MVSHCQSRVYHHHWLFVGRVNMLYTPSWSKGLMRRSTMVYEVDPDQHSEYISLVSIVHTFSASLRVPSASV